MALSKISLGSLGLTDANADRILMWDDSAGSIAQLTASTNLTISGTNITGDSQTTDLTAVADGSAGSPSIANSGDTDTGIFWGAANQLSFATGGNLRAHFNSDGNYQQGLSGGGDGIFLNSPGGGDGAYVNPIGYEGKGAFHYIFQDQGDDAGDKWSFMYGDASNGNVGADDGLRWAQFGNSSWDTELKLNQNGVLSSEGAMNASTTVDYAEYFEWKTELANDAKITETYGMTVVLDGDKVRLAEAGEEAKVLGVVRPNHTSAIVGGAQIFRYKDKYERNVWGEIQYENYTTCNWIKDGIRYSHAKDMLPDDAPKTDEEKLAVNYEERTTYRKDKGKHKKGDLLMRMKIKDSFDSTKTYIPREDRRKEWAIVGLLGQVPIRDSAVIPTSWTKMKNLESGIDLYYIK